VEGALRLSLRLGGAPVAELRTREVPSAARAEDSKIGIQFAHRVV
jgi:hypothetical protein